MIHLHTVLKITNFKVNAGSEYLWKCFGENVFNFEFFSRPECHDAATVSVEFDTQTQQVYAIECWSGPNIFRWVDSEFKDAFFAEFVARDLDPNNAYDDVDYINVDDEETILHLIARTLNEEDCSMFKNGDVIVTLDLEKEFIADLALLAHEKNVTLNELVVSILTKAMEENNAT